MNGETRRHVVAAVAKADPKVRIVMLELGVGMRLPKIRVQFERWVPCYCRYLRIHSSRTGG